VHNLETVADLTAALAGSGLRGDQCLACWQGMAAEFASPMLLTYLSPG
jgi:hypothetical protein